ncbi:MAG: type 4a pilus biogenesis protein PilO [Candidatus Omnitrophota bacterium]|nr:type 4a pilus biogenesis protein PilO [Candidatus Omnitrophota bacterium]
MNFDLNEIQNFDLSKLLQKKDLLINLLILVLALFIARGIYKAQTAQIASLKMQLNEQQQVNRLSSELETLEQELKHLQIGISTGMISTVNVMDKITELTKKRNISISSINPRSQADKGFYWQHSFEIVLEANYNQTGGFLSDIENSKDLFKVDALRVSTGTRGLNKDAKQQRVEITISAISWKK